MAKQDKTVKEKGTDSEKYPEIQTVEFDQLMDTVFGTDSVQVHGMYKFKPDLGDFVGNTLVPAVYERYRKSQNNNHIREDRSKYYIPHGKDNMQPLFMLDLQTKSTTLQSAIDQTAKSARGQGLVIATENKEVRKDFKRWLKRVKLTRKAIRRLFLNLASNKGAFVELAFNSKLEEQSGDKKVKLKSVKFPTFLNYRVGWPDEEGETTHYWYHPNFYKRNFDSKRLRAVRAYTEYEDAVEQVNSNTVFMKDLETPFYDKDSQKIHNKGRFVWHITDPTLRSESYSIPPYMTESTINAVMVEAAISQLDIAAIENGLAVAHFVTVPLIKPREDDEEATKRYEAKKKEYLGYIQSKLQGAENKDNVVVLFADPRRNHQPIEVAEVPNNNNADVIEGKYSRMIQTILKTFRITNPALIGSPPETGKGLNNQAGLLAEADDQFYTDFVLDYRELAEEFFEEIIIPIYRAEVGLDEDEDLEVIFPRKRRFNTMPSDKILLAVVPTSKIWELYNLGEYDDEARAELIRDLIDRQIAKAPAIDPATGERRDEDEEKQPEELAAAA